VPSAILYQVRSTWLEALPDGSHVGVDGLVLAKRVRFAPGEDEGPALETDGLPRVVWLTGA